MKSVPLTSRGPVDDDNFPWVASQPRVYQSQGELGFRGLHHEIPHTSTRHRRSRTTGSIASSSAFEDREKVVLPKIATGRSAKSAKKLWQDYENIKIKTHLQNELETPRIPPLYVPKNPKPLYKRPVDEWKEFDTLHFREFAEKGEIEPDDVTDCKEFYSQITFLRNAVRNIDGTTSYQNLCKKPRSWSEPSVVDDQPGLIAGNRLHWQSASKSLPHPRMLLPLKPGPNTKWYAWRVAAPDRNKEEKQKSKRKHRNDRHGAFIETFSPRVVPHPTPAVFKAHEGTPKPDNSRFLAVPHGGNLLDPAETDKTGEDRLDQVEKNKAVEPKGLTFITESKEESVGQTGEGGGNVPTSQKSAKEDAAQERVNNEAGEQGTIKNEQTVDAQEEGEEHEPSNDDQEAKSANQNDADGEKQNGEVEKGGEESSPAEKQDSGDENKEDQIPATEQEDENTQAGEVKTEKTDGEMNNGDGDIPEAPGPEQDQIVEEAAVPSSSNDVTEDAEPATYDITHGEGTLVDKNNDQEISTQEESSVAVDQPNQPQATDEEVGEVEDAEEAQAPNVADLPDDPSEQRGEEA